MIKRINYEKAEIDPRSIEKIEKHVSLHTHTHFQRVLQTYPNSEIESPLT